MINTEQNAQLLIAGFTQREIHIQKRKFYNLYNIEPFLTPMPRKGKWVGLTEDRIKEIWLNGKDHGDDWQDVLALARSFEAELKEKNTWD